MKHIISILFIASLVTSCEKTIALTYKGNQSKLIIEGNITNGSGPHTIKISKSISLSESGNYPTVDNAVVSISDDAGNSETLTARGNGAYQTNALHGIIGRTYTLTVQTDNQTYTAQSTMPQQVRFDSIKMETVSFAGELEYNVIPVYTDPVEKDNSYRFLLSINNKLVNQHFVQNDEVKNGVVNTFRLEYNDDDYELKAGDTVNITMQCVDKKVAHYYTTLALMGDSGPGGGATPNNPPTNISNGALGIFSAHTVETKRVIIQ